MVGSNQKRIAAAAAGGAIVLTVALGAALAAPALVTLPTQWRIAPSNGTVATVGTLPAGLVLSRDGTRLIELEAGHRKPALRVLDGATLREVRSVPLVGAFGVPLRDPDGDGVWVAVPGSFQEQIAHVDTASGKVDRDVSLPLPFYPVAIARAPNGTLAVAGDLGDKVALVDPGAEHVTALIPVGHHPAALAFSADSASLYVAERGESFVDAVDVATHRVRKRMMVGLHPVALAIDARNLYVADSDDDDVAVIPLAVEQATLRVAIPFARPDAFGTSPNALALDGDRLYVTCGAANAVAAYRVSGSTLVPLGGIPAGWYPTAVAVDRTHGALYIADGKGESSHANPRYRLEAAQQQQYIADQLVGSIRRVAIPDDRALARGVEEVRELAQHDPVPRDAVVRANGPIRHIIYVIKENRTYDQVLGDVRGADGDASLVLFGERVTPNEHAIVRRFGIFDRFFEDAHVSADGHNWSTAAFANDYLEKMWPQQYAGRRPFYDFEDAADAAVPHGRYLWTDALGHSISFRNYGEFVTAGPSEPVPVSASDPALLAHTDRNFPTFDMNVTDRSRFDEWKREFDAFEANGNLPQLEIVRFPRDHTTGTRAGRPTPQAMVADNDVAVGRLVDAVSHSHDWPSTAVFVVEDDAQDGPDHVDEQRSTFYLASPYAAAGAQHAPYTQASVLRTIEILLNLPPMSAYDAGARPLTAAFRAQPDLHPFTALPAQIDLDGKNGSAAYRAADSGRLDFAHADHVDPAALNDILWHAVKGRHATPPPYGLFRT